MEHGCMPSVLLSHDPGTSYCGAHERADDRVPTVPHARHRPRATGHRHRRPLPFRVLQRLALRRARPLPASPHPAGRRSQTVRSSTRVSVHSHVAQPSPRLTPPSATTDQEPRPHPASGPTRTYHAHLSRSAPAPWRNDGETPFVVITCPHTKMFSGLL